MRQIQHSQFPAITTACISHHDLLLLLVGGMTQLPRNSPLPATKRSQSPSVERLATHRDSLYSRVMTGRHSHGSFVEGGWGPLRRAGNRSLYAAAAAASIACVVMVGKTLSPLPFWRNTRTTTATAARRTVDVVFSAPAAQAFKSGGNYRQQKDTQRQQFSNQHNESDHRVGFADAQQPQRRRPRQDATSKGKGNAHTAPSRVRSSRPSVSTEATTTAFAAFPAWPEMDHSLLVSREDADSSMVADGEAILRAGDAPHFYDQRRQRRQETPLYDDVITAEVITERPGDVPLSGAAGFMSDHVERERHRELADFSAGGYAVRGEFDESKGEYELCSPLEVTGLERCPELGGDVLEKMITAKQDMLHDVVKVLTDPESAGEGGKPDEPLLLVQKLSLDEADAAFGAFDSLFRSHTTDAGGWSPEPGGFNRWLEAYHREVLHETRPVLVSVHGDEVCALEQEISREARIAAADIVTPEEREDAEKAGRLPGEGEDFQIPLVLMTLGWDPAGDPTHQAKAEGRDLSCVHRILKVNRIKTWFTSHTRYDSHTDDKFKYIPIGFGGYQTRNGLPQTAYVNAAKKQLEILDTCPHDQAGKFDLLFQGNTLDRKPRDRIWLEMTEKDTGPIPVNRAPLEAVDMVAAYGRGIFAVSPPGTGPDCFRHYELMLMGDMTFVQETDSMHEFMQDMPVVFLGSEHLRWGDLTCEGLKDIAEDVQAKIREGREGGKGFEFEKLTHNYWRNYIRKEILRAGGLPSDATFVERSTAPLNAPGWRTFRRVGCFTKKDDRHGRQSRTFTLEGTDRNPEGCAAKCSSRIGGGIAFFGIENGDQCWCDKSPGGVVAEEECHIPCDGEGDGASCGGISASTAYVFGPEKSLPFEYMGCFHDSERVMYHAEVELRDSNTPFVCEALCTSLRYPYFALEKSHWCRCGVMMYNTPRSVREPAYTPKYRPEESGPPDMAMAGKPLPGVSVGDSRFQCHKGRCAGDSTMWGCGSTSAYDLYKVVDPCILYRDCEA